LPSAITFSSIAAEDIKRSISFVKRRVKLDEEMHRLAAPINITNWIASVLKDRITSVEARVSADET